MNALTSVGIRYSVIISVGKKKEKMENKALFKNTCRTTCGQLRGPPVRTLELCDPGDHLAFCT